MQTAYQDAKDPYRIMNEHGPYAYITKGEDIEGLLRAIDYAVRMYDLMARNTEFIQSLKKLRRRNP